MTHRQGNRIDGTTHRAPLDAAMLHVWSDRALSAELPQQRPYRTSRLVHVLGVSWLLRRYDRLVSSLLGSERGRI